jgi:hypothetical protein
MAEIRKRWTDAGEAFADLGGKFQARYTGRSGGDVDARLHQAIGDAIAAVDEVLVAAGAALGDNDLQPDAQRAVTALHAALLVTFTDASDEINAASERLRVGLAQLAERDDTTGYGASA